MQPSGATLCSNVVLTRRWGCTRCRCGRTSCSRAAGTVRRTMTLSAGCTTAPSRPCDQGGHSHVGGVRLSGGLCVRNFAVPWHHGRLRLCNFRKHSEHVPNIAAFKVNSVHGEKPFLSRTISLENRFSREIVSLGVPPPFALPKLLPVAEKKRKILLGGVVGYQVRRHGRRASRGQGCRRLL